MLDRKLLSKAHDSIKQAFVPMPGGQGEPVAGASAMTAAIPAGDPAAMAGGMPPGGDPAAMAGGMPPGGDPAAMAGGMPPPPGMDPAAMAGGMPPGMPPPGGDPAAAAAGGMPPGMDPAAMGIDPAMIEQMMASMGGGGGAPAGDGTITMPTSQFLQLLQIMLGKAVEGANGGGAPKDGAKPKGGSSGKLDEIYNALQSSGIIQGQGQPAPSPAAPAM